VANGHGGRRPGAGRKRKETAEEQQTRRDVLLKVFTPERWEQIAETIAAKVEAGETVALLPYLPYLLGSPKQEHDVKVSGGVTIYLPDRRTETDS
jgi:hypothetical protein